MPAVPIEAEKAEEAIEPIRVWNGRGDIDDDASFEDREIEEGDVIAEGTTAADDDGTTPVERARFLVRSIRDHLRQLDCVVHRGALADLELLLGQVRWCPACGARLDSSSG